MRFYRTDTGQWFATQAEAKAAARELGTRWGPVDVPTDKLGLLAWLNGSRCARGALVAEPAEPGPNLAGVPPIERENAGAPAPAEPAAPAPITVTYADRSVTLDELFAAAPLGQRLTLASLALEAARSALPGTRPLS